MTQTLKPCPCGDRAFVAHVNCNSQVWCSRDMCWKGPMRETPSEAIEAWNTRPDTIESLTQRVDALETALEPFANLDDVNMHDPLSKWLTIAQIKDAVAALKHPGDR